jgi:hypothetical protein
MPSCIVEHLEHTHAVAPSSAVLIGALTVSALLSVPNSTFEPHIFFVPQRLPTLPLLLTSTPLFSLPTFTSSRNGLGHLTPGTLGQLASCGFSDSSTHSHMLAAPFACNV